MRYLLDTNIVLAILRAHDGAPMALDIVKEINTRLDIFHYDNVILISIVSYGELLSIAKSNDWGANKVARLENLLQSWIILDIPQKDKQLLNYYADIDAFSKGRHPHLARKGSAIIMGKNDLWIAASTAVAQAELLTTDADFAHLDGVFFKVHFIHLAGPD